MAEPIELPFEFWTRVGRRKQNFNRIRQVAQMCPTGAHWRNLENTTEPSVYGSDAALFQISYVEITLTICLECIF